MKVIKQRLQILITLIIAILLIASGLFIKKSFIIIIDIKVVFALLLLAATALVFIFILVYRRYNAAKLILENKILDIQVAKIEQNSTDTIEFIISCFGILLGSKVIKFNTDGIRLKEIEIAHDTICIVYGKDKKSKRIELLHGPIDKNEIKKVAERFQYETGIATDIID